LGRLLCIDYGRKRCGIAVTDPLKIIATPLITVECKTLIYWLKNYFLTEPVEKVIIGYPLDLSQEDTDATKYVQKFINNFSKVFPQIPIEKIDEQFTSSMAAKSMLEMGMKKKQRQMKENLDQLSATIMLQEYLQHGV
jgi:putative Holliday junction resolvase